MADFLSLLQHVVESDFSIRLSGLSGARHGLLMVRGASWLEAGCASGKLGHDQSIGPFALRPCCEDVDSGVPGSLQGKHCGGDDVQGVAWLILVNELIESIDCGRNPNHEQGKEHEEGNLEVRHRGSVALCSPYPSGWAS